VPLGFPEAPEAGILVDPEAALVEAGILADPEVALVVRAEARREAAVADPRTAEPSGLVVVRQAADPGSPEVAEEALRVGLEAEAAVRRPLVARR